MLDLVRRLAGAVGEAPDPSPEQWYEETYGEVPAYSKLLEQLYRSPTDRREAFVTLPTKPGS